MHELSVTESILEIALRHLPPGETTKITGIYLAIGQLSSIVDDSVQFYWDFVAKGTPAEGARLAFRRIPGQLLCMDCGVQYAVGKADLACPACGSLRAKITSGEEFFVEAIDVVKEQVQENDTKNPGHRKNPQRERPPGG